MIARVLTSTALALILLSACGESPPQPSDGSLPESSVTVTTGKAIRAGSHIRFRQGIGAFHHLYLDNPLHTHHDIHHRSPPLQYLRPGGTERRAVGTQRRERGDIAVRRRAGGRYGACHSGHKPRRTCECLWAAGREEVVATLDSLAQEIVATGNIRVLEANLWYEVSVGEATGWVNSLIWHIWVPPTTSRGK